MGHRAKKAKSAARPDKRTRNGQKHIQPCEPPCTECGALGVLVTGEAIYPQRPQWWDRKYYRCDCGAYVGTHLGTEIALGRPAGPVTRQIRGEAHAAFDALWKRKWQKENCPKHVARNAGYAWLAGQLGYGIGRCHIAWMTAEEAQAVVDICRPYVFKLETA